MFVFFQSCLSSHCYGGMSYYFSVRCCQIFKFYFSIFGIHYSGEIYLVLSDLAVLFDAVHVGETQFYSLGWYPFSSTSFSFAVQDKILQLATLMLTFFQTSFSLSFFNRMSIGRYQQAPQFNRRQSWPSGGCLVDNSDVNFGQSCVIPVWRQFILMPIAVWHVGRNNMFWKP